MASNKPSEDKPAVDKPNLHPKPTDPTGTRSIEPGARSKTKTDDASAEEQPEGHPT